MALTPDEIGGLDQQLRDDMAEAGLVPGQSPVPVRLPRPEQLFARRAERLRGLAKGHSLAGWLEFIAMLSDTQHQLASRTQLVDPEQDWPAVLSALLDALPAEVPSTVPPVVAALRALPESRLQELASQLREGNLPVADLTLAPFITAAMQVAWCVFAAGQDADALRGEATASRCPVCGSLPMAGEIHVGSESGGLRYLHCGLCHTAWHHVRASCVSCGDSAGLSYRNIAEHEDGARAEACDHCHSYLKLILKAKAPEAEPLADDLASLALDILAGEAGYARLGGNPFLILGEDGA